ncbi:MAG: glutamate--tRNA ligase [Marinilabiliales bacterium]|nr:glutamate--tRNA ligase [Marinilabiliales bacterium]
MEKRIRVRFAPSPTGPLHIGGVRTALFNYLFARHHGGDFLLRIEDTDQTRYVPGAEEYIMEALDWCGITIDEGPREGGPHAPYRQSERKEIYAAYAQQLVDSGHAYFAFDTADELDVLRSAAEAKGETFTYNNVSRNQLINSLSLTAAECAERIGRGDHYVIRFKMPDHVMVEKTDLIRGNVRFNTDQLDDKVLYKSDGMPTYHLANVVDDHLMEITHVIRGEEWLPSLPLHVLLYKAFGWEDTMPEFSHLPLILKPAGKGKLSKRDGDQLGFPVFPLAWKDPVTGDVSRGYREDGYLRDGFINMLSLLGWNPGTEQEIFSMQELIAGFTLERVGKSGSRFDPEKTRWFNHQYMMRTAADELVEMFMPLLAARGIATDRDLVLKVVGMVRERCTFVQEIWDQGFFFFEAPQGYDEKIVAKRWKDDVPEMMAEIARFFGQVVIWEPVALKNEFSSFVNQKGWNFGTIMNSLRLCLVGGSFGPDIFEICGVLGKEESIRRIEVAVQKIIPA